MMDVELLPEILSTESPKENMAPTSVMSLVYFDGMKYPSISGVALWTPVKWSLMNIVVQTEGYKMHCPVKVSYEQNWHTF